MADNYSKLWVQSNLNKTATNRALEAIENTGRALPCSVVAVSGSIVTVKFEVNTGNQTLPNVTMPKAESQWFRAPTQIGDTGMTIPCDVYLGGISGLGGGIARLLQRRGNLSRLMFQPCASTAFAAAPDQNKAWVNGPAGAVLSTKDGTVSITVSESEILFKVGGNTWSMTDVLTLATGVVAETHQHSYIPGSNPPAETGGPIA